MKTDLEHSLWLAVRGGMKPRDWILNAINNGFIKSPKQAWATLKKWAGREKYGYDCGVSIDLGWIYDGTPDPFVPAELAQEDPER